MEMHADKYNINYLLPYHPYRVAGVVNPNFGKDDGLLLDLKDRKDNAIIYFSNILNQVIPAGVSICVVPSHDPDSEESGIGMVAKNIAGNGRIDKTACLQRHTKIEKLAKGGSRSLDIHTSSISVTDADSIKGATVWILDDVTTTGNSLLACKQLIEESGANSVSCFAIGNTRASNVNA